MKNLNRLTLITGLIGSGKTFLAESLAASPHMGALQQPVIVIDVGVRPGGDPGDLTRKRLEGLLARGRVIVTALTKGYRHITTRAPQ